MTRPTKTSKCVVAGVLACAAGVLGFSTDANAAPTRRVLDRDAYADRLRAMWMAQSIANWTGLRTEGRKQGPPFYTDADWGSGSGGSQITYVFQDPWGADDDTDIEYVYLHLWNQHATSKLSATQIAAGWQAHINRFIWVSNQKARALMDRGVVPPATGYISANPDALRIDAQLTTEIYGALCPGMPEEALARGELAIATTSNGYATHAAQFFVVLYALATQVDPALSGRDQALWLVREARKFIPDSSKTADACDLVLADFLANPDINDWESTRDKVYARYQLNAAANGFVYRNWYESTVNFAGGVAALLYGQCDLKRMIQIGTLWGWDSDNATATLGGLYGLMRGTQAVRDAFPGQTISDRYWAARTRDNLPDYLPADPDADDTFTMMAERMLPRVEQAIVESGGKVDADARRWALPRPVGGVPLAFNPSWQLALRSANRQVRDLGGVVTASANFGAPPGGYGSGGPNAFSNNTELDGRGTEVPDSLTPFYSSQGTPSPITLSVTYDRAVAAHTIRFVEGNHFADANANGGWFTSVAVQVRVGGSWITPAGTWSEALDASRPFQILDFTLGAPAAVTGVRLVGPGGGTGAFVTCAEIDVLSASQPPTRQSMDLNGDGTTDINDLHWLHGTPIDVDGNGTADASDRAYLEAWLRSGERGEMESGRR
ncbi:MAG: ADP-ribosylglycohydrolase family protein [Planctomycetota bacterium]|nr:ADP-ribosylglycohydrolase family protein [Planctomycetota bacterium]